MLKRLVCAVLLLAGGAARAQQAAAPASPAAPVRTFANRCRICHGSDGNGAERAPSLLGFVSSHSDAEVAALVRTGRPDKGMPHFDFTDDEMKALLVHLRGLVAGTVNTTDPRAAMRGAFQPHPASLTLQDGRKLEGTLTSETAFSATLATPDGKFHLLSRNGDAYSERPIEPKRDWTSYDGSFTGNRYSSLDQINVKNAQRLAPAWVFPESHGDKLEVTPVVQDGVMYITAPNEAYALDATTGPADMGLQTAAHPRASKLGGRGRESRRGHLGEPRLHGDRQRAPAGARSHHGPQGLGRHDGRYQGRLQRDCRSAGYRGPGAFRRGGRRRRSARLCGCLQGGLRRTGLAFLHHAAARRERLGNLDWKCARAWLRRNVADRLLRSRSGDGLLGRRQSLPGFQWRRTQGRQPVHRQRRGAGREDRENEVVFPVHSPRCLRLGFGRPDDPGG